MPHYCTDKDCPFKNIGRKRANYALSGEKAKYCKKCSLKYENMINVNVGNRTCIYVDPNTKVRCTTQPTFNIPGKPPKYCNNHRDKKTMINTLNRKCIKCKKALAYYNHENKKIAEYCYDCKDNNMINVKNYTCHKCTKNAGYCNSTKTVWACGKHKGDFKKPNAIHCEDGCGKEAGFNFLGEKKPRFCSKHKDPNMIDVIRPMCKDDSCFHQATFGYKKDKKRLYCSLHFKDDMECLVNRKKCLDCGEKQPNFNWRWESSPIYCGDCKLDDMVNICTKKCAKCEITANFNYEGFITPKYCKKHIEDGMICVTKRSCRFSGCSTRPSFNFQGQVTPLFCDEHKKPNMINVKRDLCISCKKTSAHFNFPGEPKRYCGPCSTDGMINLKSRKCQHEKCDGIKHAIYNFPNETIGKFCLQHKTNDMINITSFRCDDPKCSQLGKTATTALYGYPGGESTKCNLHKLSGMIIFPRNKCLNNDCDEYAIFALNSSRAQYCEEHAPSNYSCVISQPCNGCNFIEIIDEEGFCSACHPDKFKTARLAKQRQVVAWLNANGFNDYKSIDTVPDEIMECREGQKYTYRPDIFYDCGTHYVIVEVDEKQHSDDTYKRCDIPRMINIQQSLALPTIFIRYNPDSFKIDNKIINVSNANRMQKLGEWISHTKNNITTDPLTVVYLFYDGYNASNTYLKDIDIMSYIQKPKRKLNFKMKYLKKNNQKLNFKQNYKSKAFEIEA
tara:strand:+ start:1445 stop:3634 length:2190 start_codon:yes stop_codon:yes gene_type:complete